MSYALSARRLAVAAAMLSAAMLMAMLPGSTFADRADATAVDDPFPRQLVTVSTPTRADKARLQAIRVSSQYGPTGLDLTEHAGHDYIEVVLHSAAEADALRAEGFTWDVRIPDLDARALENARKDLLYASTVAVSPLPSGRNTYRTLADYNSDMKRLADSHPKIATRFRLRYKTIEGRPIYGLKIGRGVDNRRTGRPVFVMLGLHHAREWPSGEHAMEFAFDLVRNYSKGQRITRLLNKSLVIVVPVVNPDGFHASITDGLEAPADQEPTNEYKRKNCRMVDGERQPPGPCEASKSPLGFGVGVDLNRNYGAFWGGPGAAEEHADPTYRGAQHFSEPETRAIKNLIRRRHVTGLITNHTFSNLVLRPNGVNPQTIGPDGLPVGSAPDEAAMRRLGRRMTEQNGYANIHGWELYDTTGTTEDWSYNATGGYGYTFEIGAEEFHPPFEEVVKEYRGRGQFAGRGNREAYLLALDTAVDPDHHSVIAGRVPKHAKLHLVRHASTPTWEDTFRDRVNTWMRADGDGRYRWHVNPSTRPLVQAAAYQVLGKPFGTKVYEGTTPPFMDTDNIYKVPKDADVLDIRLDWPTPDDLDLTVYRRVDGKFKQVAQSAAFVREKERVMIERPRAGQVYRLRVTNFASGTPRWTLTSSLRSATTRYKDRLFEVWTMRCERRGKIRQTKRVFVERGVGVKVNFDRCGK